MRFQARPVHPAPWWRRWFVPWHVVQVIANEPVSKPGPVWWAKRRAREMSASWASMAGGF